MPRKEILPLQPSKREQVEPLNSESLKAGMQKKLESLKSALRSGKLQGSEIKKFVRAEIAQIEKTLSSGAGRSPDMLESRAATVNISASKGRGR